MRYDFDLESYKDLLLPLLKDLEKLDKVETHNLAKLVKNYAKPEGGVFSKDQIIAAYREYAGKHGLKPYSEKFVHKIQMKPSRTMSGVATVTVLTKPFPCPGKCIFCPNDIRMPKSYLADEPGAQRAERNYFDPYLQTYNRLQALHNIGHPLDKVEVIVLGGTWSYYPEEYQVWFIQQIFLALNDFGTHDNRATVFEVYEEMKKKYEKLSKKRKTYIPTNIPEKNKELLDPDQIDGQKLEKTYNQVISDVYVAPEKLAGFDEYQKSSWEELEKQQRINETAKSRCVGLVIETRPDNISKQEVMRIRRLGCTKAQIGLQSLQDSVLEKNKRGHDVAASRRAIALLRQAGFKIHAHWMANLYGSSVKADNEDYTTMFADPDFRPDELKIYPCSLIGSAELMQVHKQGKWKPYTYEELVEVLRHVLLSTPEYCRLTRIIRDIPSTDIVEGNKLTNFRQIAEQKLAKAGKQSKDIRAREIRNTRFDATLVTESEVRYSTSVSEEVFIQYTVPVTENGTTQHKLLGFLRLSLPTEENWISELEGAAIIREVHVYGEVAKIGSSTSKKAQHLGIGTKLLKTAKKIASSQSFKRLAVISAIGTREYYRKRGFEDGELYQCMTLK